MHGFRYGIVIQTILSLHFAIAEYMTPISFCIFVLAWSHCQISIREFPPESIQNLAEFCYLDLVQAQLGIHTADGLQHSVLGTSEHSARRKAARTTISIFLSSNKLIQSHYPCFVVRLALMAIQRMWTILRSWFNRSKSSHDGNEGA